MESLFEFGDDVNDLNELEMHVSYQDIELFVKFQDMAQFRQWKSEILYAQGKATARGIGGS